MKAEFISEVKNGRLSDRAAGQIKACIKALEGKRVVVAIDRVKSVRTVQQNRLWWVYMGILSKDLGYTKEEIHEICKFKFLKREKVHESTGEIFNYLESTTKLNKSEFADLVSDLQQWSAETFNILLPSPDEQLLLI